MKKLAKKLSIFALSSIILLSNSPIKAGMFAEGQTYDLGEFGTVNIRNHDINNDGSLEAFDVHIKDSKLYIEVYHENDGIAYALRNAGTVVSSGTIEHCKNFRNAEYVLNILIKKITGKDLTTFPRLIPSTPECSMTTIETSVMDETQKTPKHTKQKSEKSNKHVEEKKPKKENQPEYRKIKCELPKAKVWNYKRGHCACEQPVPGKVSQMHTKIDGNPVTLHFYPCLKCLQPIRQSRKHNRSCCWKTYCKECNCETEFYMTHGKNNEIILRCCQVFPFEIHEIEYASPAEFNAAVDRKQLKYLCSKDPSHIRAHFIQTNAYRGAHCLDCMNEARAARQGTK